MAAVEGEARGGSCGSQIEADRSNEKGSDMEMSGATVVGLMAAFCTTLAYAPQAIKTWRTRSTRDISLGMFSLMVVGMACWLLYGLMIGDVPLIAANLVTLTLASMILALKLRHG